MKVAILTLPLRYNYGGILQAFALQKVIQGFGHEVYVYNNEFAHYVPNYARDFIAFFYRIFRRLLFNQKQLPLLVNKYNRLVDRTICRNTRDFINKYIHEIPFEYVLESKKCDVDVIIVGSDQVWRKSYYTSVSGDTNALNMFLDFAKKWKIRRLAYAPSFGSNVWELNEEETKKASELIKLFDAISVREHSGIDLCDKYLRAKAIQVIDPTLLLDANYYLELIDCSRYLGKHPRSIMSYILDMNTEMSSFISEVSVKLNLSVNTTNNPKLNDFHEPLENRVQPAVENWLASFNDAKYVITDSFHACVFSILFRKPFVVYSNMQRGQSRIKSLLSMFGLENRLVRNGATLTQSMETLLNPIDWEKVQKSLIVKRNEALSFLSILDI